MCRFLVTASEACPPRRRARQVPRDQQRQSLLLRFSAKRILANLQKAILYSLDRRAHQSVVLIARRCATGMRRRAMQASKSFVKQATALGGTVSKSATTPAASSRAMALDSA